MYTFSRSEKNKPIAEEYETRAMLYLMNKTWDESLDIFLIDSFNDVSGTNQHFNYIVDLQAKGIKDFPPSKIGESLITLFLNYISDFTFDAYILYCKSLNNDYLIESRNVGISSHTVNEISDDTIERIKKALVKTINKEFGEEYLKVLGDGILSEFFEKLHIVSNYNSENLIHELLQSILLEDRYSKYKYQSEVKIKELLREISNLSFDEITYIQNNARIDFLIYNKFDNQPILAIEVDGFEYHENKPQQLTKDKLKDSILKKYDIPILRLQTNHANEEEKIKSFL